MKNNIIVSSWNMNRRNFLNEVKISNFENCDVIFLQEVNQKSLKFLTSLSDIYEIFYAREILTTFYLRKEYFLVTLISKSSNFEIIKSKVSSITTFQSFIYKLVGRKIYIEFISINIKAHPESRIICLVNCHLQFACSPENRRKQFKEILTQQQEKNLIIGGDLNLFIYPPLSFIFWFFMGIKSLDLFKNERSEFLKNFPDFNALSKTNTTIYKSGKLDYVLLSGNIKGISEKVLTNNRMGSDHFPVITSIEIS